MPDVHAGTNRLIGRERELATLGSFLGEAVVDGATLLLTGEPGVGKTALLAAAAETATTDGVRVIRGGGIPQLLHAHTWPRITRFDDRWRWIVTSIVPRFQRFDCDTRLAAASLRRIFDEARDYASNPCVLPRSPQPATRTPTTADALLPGRTPGGAVRRVRRLPHRSRRP
jgi:AAA ATPase domain